MTGRLDIGKADRGHLTSHRQASLDFITDSRNNAPTLKFN